MSKKSRSAAVSRSSLFGPPLVLEGEIPQRMTSFSAVYTQP